MARRTTTALVAFLLLHAGAAARVVAQRTAAFEVHEATIAELQAAMAEGRITAAALVDAYLARIRAYDPLLNAIIRLDTTAHAQAARLDAERARGAVRGPLHGVPILLKDNFDTGGFPTTGASIALAASIPPDDATVVRRLREAGAVILGKTNLHELAAGITTVSSLGGQTRNPYDPARNPGGSSGGTGAAVAASMAAIGYGSDTCGSIRIPSAFNALFGLRPTKGLISGDGIIPLSHTQDVPGPLARTVADLAVGLDAVAGPDAADPATRILAGRAPPRFADALRTDALRGARIGVLDSLFGAAPEDQEASGIVRAALRRMEDLGATLVPVDIPRLDSLLADASVIGHEFKFDLIDYLAGIPDAPIDSLGDVVARGLHHAALDETFRRRNAVEARETEAYRRTRERQAEVRGILLAAFERDRLDAIAYPTMRRAPALIGEPQRGGTCQLSAVTGTPALSMPAGFTDGGLPLGLELIGRPLDDAKLVGYAYAWEQAAHPRRPPTLTPPLTDGRAPAAIPVHTIPVRADAVPSAPPARLSWDATTGTLHYEIGLDGFAPGRVHAVAIHRTVDGRLGPVVHRLAGPDAATTSGPFTLTQADRAALQAGTLRLALHARGLVGGPAVWRLEL